MANNIPSCVGTEYTPHTAMVDAVMHMYIEKVQVSFMLLPSFVNQLIHTLLETWARALGHCSLSLEHFPSSSACYSEERDCSRRLDTLKNTGHMITV